MATPSTTVPEVPVPPQLRVPPSPQPIERIQPQVPMPRPRQLGAPYFEGENVTRFLEEFEDLCDEYNLTSVQRLKKLPLYCDQMIGDNITYSAPYNAQNYKDVVAMLKRDFRRKDRAQTVYTYAYLDDLCRKMTQDEGFLEDFVREYTTVSTALRAQRKIEEWTQCATFVECLPPMLSYNVRRELHLDRTVPERWVWDKILRKVKEEISLGTQNLDRRAFSFEHRQRVAGNDSDSSNRRTNQTEEDRLGLKFAPTNTAAPRNNEPAPIPAPGQMDPTQSARQTFFQGPNFSGFREPRPQADRRDINDLTRQLSAMAMPAQAPNPYPQYPQYPSHPYIGAIMGGSNGGIANGLPGSQSAQQPQMPMGQAPMQAPMNQPMQQQQGASQPPGPVMYPGHNGGWYPVPQAPPSQQFLNAKAYFESGMSDRRPFVNTRGRGSGSRGGYSNMGNRNPDRAPIRCFYCGMEGHPISICQLKESDMSNGYVHRNHQEGVWYLGRPSKCGPPLFWEKGAIMRNSVIDYFGAGVVLGGKDPDAVENKSNEPPNGYRGLEVRPDQAPAGTASGTTSGPTLASGHGPQVNGLIVSVGDNEFSENDSFTSPAIQASLEAHLVQSLSQGKSFQEAVNDLDGYQIDVLVEANQALMNAVKRKAEDGLPEVKSRKQGRVMPVEEEVEQAPQDEEMPDAPPAPRVPRITIQRGSPKPPIGTENRKRADSLELKRKETLQPHKAPAKTVTKKGLPPEEPVGRISTEKKKVEPKKTRTVQDASPLRKLANETRDQTDPMDIVLAMMNSPVTLTHRQILGIAPKVHRAYFSTLPTEFKAEVHSMTEDTVEATVANMSFRQRIPRSRVYYFGDQVYVAQILKVSVAVNGNPISAMIDTGAEVNCITEGLAEYLGLEVFETDEVEVKVQTSQTVPCQGYCMVPVEIEGLIIPVRMWVMHKGENGFILGRPWQEQARWGCQTHPNGQVDCWIYSENGGEKVSFVAYVPDMDPKRKTRNQLLEYEEDHVDHRDPCDSMALKWGPDKATKRSPEMNGPAEDNKPTTRKSICESKNDRPEIANVFSVIAKESDKEIEEQEVEIEGSEAGDSQVDEEFENAIWTLEDDITWEEWKWAFGGEDCHQFETTTGELILPRDVHEVGSIEVDYRGTAGGQGTMVEVSNSEARHLDLGWDYWMDTGFEIENCWIGSTKGLGRKELTGTVNRRHMGQVMVNTMYKKKADKVQPVNQRSTDGAIPGGAENWQELVLAHHYPGQDGEKDGLFHPRIARFEPGTRLTAERLKEVSLGIDIRPAERIMFEEMLMRREGCLGWNFTDVGRIREEVTPDLRIQTVEHEAWQERGFKVPHALREKVVTMLKDRIKNGIMERCEGPYRNPWFLVPKKNGDFRLVIGATKMNSVTRRDANMPPNCDEFAEDFGGCAITSLVDLYSGYDQLILYSPDRDITAIMTPLGLLRMTRIVQGGTNSVAQFVRVISKILEDIMPHICRVFLDDIGIKGPKTRYNDEESLIAPGCRRFVVEHMINIDETLYLLELAGATVSVAKSQFLTNGVKIVGWVCDFDGRKAENKKVEKILNWPRPQTVRDIRSFVSTASYFRVLIREFQWVASPLYDVTRSKNPKFFWREEQQEAFDKLKEILATNPVVLPLDYEADPLIIIVAVDASLRGWGAVLMQHQRGRRHPARYESGIWSKAESEYDAGKREARAVLKALKKFKSFLYGVHFTLEVDSETVVAQLNRSATDLPGALVNQWLAWIRLFEFSVKHVRGTKHGGPDGLSRRPSVEGEEDLEDNTDERILADLSPLIARVNPVLESESDRILDMGFSDESEEIAQWLLHFRKPNRLSGSSLSSFKKKAYKFLVQDDQLYKRRKAGEQPALVVDNLEDRKRILSACHEELGHRGRESTYHHIKRRYHWDGLYLEVVRHVKTCPECQARDPVRLEEPLQATMVSQLFRRINMDITYMPPSEGKSLLVVARDDLSHWVEARALRVGTSKAVAQFFYEDIICRHGVPYEVRVDGGPENQGELRALLESMRVKIIKISPYNSKAAGSVEVGHKAIQSALSKITKGTGKGWTKHLSSVLFADRTTTKHSTGRTPYELLYGEHAVLPIECEVPSWQTRNWSKIRNTADLLATRARQIERRDKDIVEAACHVERMREQNQSYFDRHHSLRLTPLQPNDLVLLHNTKLDKELTSDRKLQYRWVGPYKIHEVLDNGTYRLRELDGTTRHDTIHGNRLKKYLTRPDKDTATRVFPWEDSTDSGEVTQHGPPEESRLTTRQSVWNNYDPDESAEESEEGHKRTTRQSIREQRDTSDQERSSGQSDRPPSRKSVSFSLPPTEEIPAPEYVSLSGRESDPPPKRVEIFRAVEIPKSI